MVETKKKSLFSITNIRYDTFKTPSCFDGLTKGIPITPSPLLRIQHLKGFKAKKKWFFEQFSC